MSNYSEEHRRIKYTIELKESGGSKKLLCGVEGQLFVNSVPPQGAGRQLSISRALDSPECGCKAISKATQKNLMKQVKFFFRGGELFCRFECSDPGFESKGLEFPISRDHKGSFSVREHVLFEYDGKVLVMTIKDEGNDVTAENKGESFPHNLFVGLTWTPGAGVAMAEKGTVSV